MKCLHGVSHTFQKDKLVLIMSDSINRISYVTCLLFQTRPRSEYFPWNHFHEKISWNWFHGKISLTYQSGIIVSQDAHSDRFPLESLGECLTKMSIANSSYSSLCCGLSSSKDSSLIKAREVVPKARLAHEESAKREYMSSWLKISS